MFVCNQPIFAFLFWTLGDLIGLLVIGGIFFWVFGLLTLLRWARSRESKTRAEMEPLCVWEYAAAEWQKYAADYDLAKCPKGAARVSITLLDIWIADDGKVRRTILDDMRKCVTACRFSNQMLKIRVRSWAIPGRFGSVVHTVEDVNLPVPFGKEREMIEVARLFNEKIVRMNKKVVSVMPDNFSSGAIGETDF